MNAYQKYFIKLIVLSTLILTFSSLSGQNSINSSATVFRQAKIMMDENQKAPLEVRFQENQKVAVISFFESYRDNYKWSKNSEAILFKAHKDDLGQVHHRFKQYYKGVELAEVQYLLHEKEGSVTYAHGKLIHGLNIDVTPAISENDALSKALAHINAESYMWENRKNEAHMKREKRDREATYYPVGELKISAGLKDHVAENFKLVYRFDIFAEKPMSRNYVDVDAKTGEIVGVLPRMYSDDVQGHGTSLYNGSVDIVVADTNYYRLEEPPAHFHVNDWNSYGGSGTSWWIADTTFGDQGGYGDVWYETLDTDPILLDGENISLKFNHRFSVEPPSPNENYDGWDGMNVRISDDGGETWQILLNPTPIYSNESLFSFGAIFGEGEGIPGWAGELNEWTEVNFDISSYAGQTVQVRFAFASDEFVSTEDGEPDWFGWQLDDIIISSSTETLYTNYGIEEGMTASNDIKEVIGIPGNYRLRESDRGGGIVTYDKLNQELFWKAVDFVDSDSNFTDTNARAGVSAHWAVEATYDYFLAEHGRNSFDDEGGRIKSYVHAGEFFNAFWNGEWMEFGDGDASNGFQPLVSIDIVAHEFTHGVTDYSADLIYSYESGALNESISDIFGEHVESYALDGDNDWLMGDDVGALRSFTNPNAFGQPDTYLGSLWYTGAADNGGVHINSGVQNFWFYLLSEGGTGVNDHGDTYTVTGIGMEDAVKIAYRNLSVYLMPTSQYEDSRRGSLNAAIDLFGATSQQFASALDAWNAVGVYYPFIGPYAENTSVNSTFFEPGNDTLIVTTNIVNPKNHEIEVKTIIESFDLSIQDTLDMFDDGIHQDSLADDGVWGESWPIPEGERHYSIHTTTTSLDSGFQNILKDAATFTTIGPVKVEGHFDEVLRLGVFSQRFLFKLKLQNLGQVAAAEGIGARVKLLSPDSCFAMADSYREYGDIAAGEIVDGLQNYSIILDTTCLNSSSVVMQYVVEIESNGYVFWADTFSIDIIATDIADINSSVPDKYSLRQNYPNPFNPSTIINYELPIMNYVELTIHNLLGQKVATLVSKVQKAGHHQVEWDASGTASGVYYYQIKTGDFQAVRKMILLR